MKRTLIAALLLAGLGLAAPQAQAQTGTARGKVLDAQGQPIADAKVLIEFQGGVTRKFEVKTNKKGEYMQVGMQPGPYRFTASKDGYQPSFVEPRDLARRSHADPRLQAEHGGPGRGRRRRRRGVGAARQLPRRPSSCRPPARSTRPKRRTRPSWTTSPDVPEVYQNLGQLYVQKKDYPAAEAAFQKGLELRPDSTDMATLLARVYQESGQTDKAMALIEKSAGANPQDAKAQFNRGIFLLNANKNEEAIAAFEAAIKADPNMAEAYYHLGALLIGQGKIPEAIAVPREVPEPQPDGRAERGDGPGAAEGPQEVIAERVAAVRERIARAAERASRPPDDVTLVAREQDAPGRGRARGLRGGRCATSARTASRRPSPRSPPPPTSRAGCAGTSSGTSSRTRRAAPRRSSTSSSRSTRSSSPSASRAPARRPGATVRGLVQVDLAGEATKYGLARGRAPPGAARRCADGPACGSRA